MQLQEKHKDIWDSCLRIIQNVVEPQQFATWFKPVTPVSFAENTLTVQVPSDFFREYLESAFLDVIRLTLKRVIGSDAKLEYLIQPVRGRETMRIPGQQVLTPTNVATTISTYNPTERPSVYSWPGTQHQVKINPRLNPNYCFANLVQGECNKMGVTAGLNISAAPGKTPFNPLFIFGGPGLGKTHLAQAIGIAAHEQFPSKIVLYVTGSEFKTQYMDAINVHNKLTDFLAYYMKIDILIVDDIQDLMGPGAQNAFFNVFNSLHQNGKQLVFTSDRPAMELQNFEERLLSRFKWGLSVQLTRPDYETRLNMLRARAHREGVTMSEDVLEYLASSVQTNFRELEGAFVSVMAYSTMQPGTDQMEIARSITTKLVGEVHVDINMEKVERSVCEYFSLTRQDIISNSRKRQIVQARQIAMYLCRQLISNCSLSTIGMEIGGKDHATVLHACNTVSNLMTTDPMYRKYVKDLEQIITSKR